MTTSTLTSLRPARAMLVAVAVSAALLYSTQSGALVRALANATAWPKWPYLVSGVATASDLLVMALLVMAAAGLGAREAARLSGISASPRQPLRWAAWVLVPALLACALLAQPSPDLGMLDFAWRAVGSPVFEELTYRGLAVGALMRICGWRLLPACLWPAVFFGVAHAWQGADLASALGIAAITGAGGLLFGWLYVRWGFNLWPALLLHVGMNGLWEIFAFGEDAIGGWLGNGVRLAVVLAAVLLTFRFAPGRRRRGADPVDR
ncbi:CPBP family intramembrane glutamic endopeptidase [Luteimonas vadosa]|uniref:CAAX prenyl protease 2/Lysostaphin resistance protein A-like domain-containing protein n=1 Tax=Luteimonas vadosa TaxID=1165507 RepID=A0ABP9E4I4_9GAMM